MIKKIMILIITTFVVIAFIRCGRTCSDYAYGSSYIYKNESSRDITIDSYCSADGKTSTFVIRVGESHTLRFVTMAGFQDPFGGTYNPNPTDYVIVSNGEKQFENVRYSPEGDDKLFRLDSYEIIEESKRNRERVCQYIFTDKDFENADPIEP